MDIQSAGVLTAIGMSFGAGFLSVASPCVLPVLPIIVTGSESDSRFRPLLIVLGLSLTFILMGVVTSAFGSLITGRMYYIEKIAGSIIVVFGLLMLADKNIFKNVTFFNRLSGPRKGIWSGFVIGATLGLIWIPCIGPLLSGVLAMVATKANIGYGVLLLAFYSLGFSIPVFLAGYFSQFFRKKLGTMQKSAMAIRIISGVLLILFGIYIIVNGLVAFTI